MMRCEVVASSGEKEDGPRENAMLDWDQEANAARF